MEAVYRFVSFPEIAVAAGANSSIPRTRIAGAPINGIGLGIVRADQPGGAAAPQSGVPFPGIAAGLAGRRYCKGLPDLLSGVQVERLKRATNTILATTKTGDHLVANDQRWRSDDRTLLVVDYVSGPERLTCCSAEIPEDVLQYACRDVNNRGVTFADGKIFVGRLDGKLTALDWRSRNRSALAD